MSLVDRRLKTFPVLLLVLLLLLLTIASTAAFAVDGTSFGAKLPGDTEPDTRRAAYWCRYYCNNYAGYNIYETNETTSQFIWEWARDYDAIEFLAQHANAGLITAVEDYNDDGVWNKTYLYAGKGGEQNTSGKYYLSTYTSTNVNDVLLWIFSGCLTANTSDTYGNLQTMAVNKGVDCVITYSSTLSFPTTNVDRYGNLFWREFWYYAARMGNSVYDSHNTALYNLYQWEGSYCGFDSRVLYNSGISIVPARYGS